MSGEEESVLRRTHWTYDDPCQLMQRSVVPFPSVQDQGDDSVIDSVDLTLIGMYGYSDSPGDQLSFLKPPIKSSITTVAADHISSFKNASKLGARTPTLRIVSEDGGLKSYALIGLGPKEDASAADAFKIGSTVATICDEEKGCASCLVVLPKGTLVSSMVRDFNIGFRVQLYSDNRYRTGDNVKEPAKFLKKVYLSEQTGDDNPLYFPNISLDTARGTDISEAQMLAMDIVNAPHNVLNSESLANLARDLTSSTLTCRILDKAECERRGMGAYLAVARGSETEPQLIHLTYRPSSGEIKQRLGVVGKGVLFDTGGYNIKTFRIELMKFDCGGAAAVLGAARAVDRMQPPGVEAHFIVPACENMISAKAYAPGDVLTASNGKTIEVNDTDAEGRLTLADALVYADQEVGCDKIIELSTLTGSCIAALGWNVAGLWSDDDGLAQELDEAAKISGEKVWRMPMVKEYMEQLDSKIADLQNFGSNKGGGGITAALFLSQFVDDKKPFAHFDVAGPIWDEKKGATGYGVRMVAEWICRSSA